MNRGVFAGLKRLFVPSTLGGGDSANDGLALVLDSTQEGGVRSRGNPSGATDLARWETVAGLSNPAMRLTSSGLLRFWMGPSSPLAVVYAGGDGNHPGIAATGTSGTAVDVVLGDGNGKGGRTRGPFVIDSTHESNAATVKLKVHAAASQSADIIQALDSAGATLSRIDKAGRFVTAVGAAPALGDLVDGETAISRNAGGDLIITSRVAGALKTATITVT